MFCFRTRCFVSGDLLVMGLASNQSNVPPFLDLKQGNGIRRMGSTDPTFSPECLPVKLSISTKKVSFNFSLFLIKAGLWFNI